MKHLQMNEKKLNLSPLVHHTCSVKKTLTQTQLEELQSVAQKQSNFLVPSLMKHCLLSNMWHQELNWHSMGYTSSIM